MITFASLGCSVLIFGIIGLSGVGSVIPLAILYGFFAGVCKYILSFKAQILTVISCIAAIAIGSCSHRGHVGARVCSTITLFAFPFFQQDKYHL